MRKWRVGTVSMGILLVALGIGLLFAQINQIPVLEFILKWWPVVLVILGIETLVYVFTSKQDESKVKFDVFSIILISLIMIFSVGAYAVSSLLKGVNIDTIFPAFMHYNYESSFVKKMTVDPEGKSKMLVENAHGNVYIEKGTGANIEVEANITIRNNDEEYAKNISDSLIEVTVTDKVKIRSRRNDYLDNKAMIKSININYTIKVPKDIEIEVDNAHGEISMEGILKPSKVICRHGEIRLREMGGNVEVDNSHGNIRASGVKGNLDLQNSHANVSVENISGTLSVETSFCEVDIRNIGGNIEVTGNNGKIDIRNAAGDVKSSNRFGDIYLENANKKIDIRNSNGKIMVESDKLIEKDVRLENRFGDIVLVIPKNQQGHFKANTRLGKILNKLNLEVNEKINEQTMEGKIGTSGVVFDMDNQNGNIEILTN